MWIYYEHGKDIGSRKRVFAWEKEASYSNKLKQTQPHHKDSIDKSQIYLKTTTASMMCSCARHPNRELQMTHLSMWVIGGWHAIISDISLYALLTYWWLIITHWIIGRDNTKNQNFDECSPKLRIIHKFKSSMPHRFPNHHCKIKYG